MFGAINSLFTAFAFAGLIYTAWLQRDQLALQQQEIRDSEEKQKRLLQEQLDAQNQLFERQKEFQEKQAELRKEHDKALEQLREDVQTRLEEKRKDHQQEETNKFNRNVLAAIRRELEALGQIYDQGIGKFLKETPAGGRLQEQLRISQDWFTVFTANAVHLGRLDADLSRMIVSTYALLKAVVEEYKINNEILDRLAEIRLVWEGTAHPPEGIELKYNHVCHSNVLQTERIRKADAALANAKSELFAKLDQAGIN
jgi:hypothetical protein